MAAPACHAVSTFTSTYLDVEPEPRIDLDDDMPLVANIRFNLGNSRLQQLVQDDVAFFTEGLQFCPVGGYKWCRGLPTL
jgi:hypothetical protein